MRKLRLNLGDDDNEKLKLCHTMGIKHRADSGFRKFLVLNKLCLYGLMNSSEMSHVSYPIPLAHI